MLMWLFGKSGGSRAKPARPIFYNIWFLVTVMAVVILTTEGLDYIMLWHAMELAQAQALTPPEKTVADDILAHMLEAVQQPPSSAVSGFIMGLSSLLLAFKPNGEKDEAEDKRTVDELRSEVDRLTRKEKDNDA